MKVITVKPFKLFEKYGIGGRPGHHWAYGYRVFYDAFSLEHHTGQCTCSYCKDTPSVIGYRSPASKNLGAWYRVYLKLSPVSKWYLRWSKKDIKECLSRRKIRNHYVVNENKESSEECCKYE